MTITLRASGTAVAAQASVTPSYPAGIQAGDAVFMLVENKPFSQTPTITGGGWTQVNTITNGSTAAGTDLGSVRATVFRKDTVAGGESGTVTCSITSSTSSHIGAKIIAWAKTLANWNITSTTGSDNTTTTGSQAYTITGAATLGMVGGDWMIVSNAKNTDNVTGYANATLVVTGITLSGTGVEINWTGDAAGGDGLLLWHWQQASSGTASAAPVYRHDTTVAQASQGAGVFVLVSESGAVTPTPRRRKQFPQLRR